MQQESLLHNHGFEELLLEAIDEGLSSLGDSAKQAVYFYLKEEFRLDKQDIPRKIGKFADAIERTFGLGSRFLKILIVRRIYKKVGRVFERNEEPQDLIFTEYVETARQSFQKKIEHELIQCKSDEKLVS